MKRLIGLCILALLACAIAPVARAQESANPSGGTNNIDVDKTLNPTGETVVGASTTKGPFYEQSKAELRARKLTRGAANVFLCIAEIPNQMFREAYATSPVTGAVVGAGKGVLKGGKRFIVGLWEIATFYNPGSNHYQPIVQPEVVFGEYSH